MKERLGELNFVFANDMAPGGNNDAKEKETLKWQVDASAHGQFREEILGSDRHSQSESEQSERDEPKYPHVITHNVHIPD